MNARLEGSGPSDERPPAFPAWPDPSPLLDAYRALTPGSAQLAKRALGVLANGVSTDTRVFEPYGIFIDRAQGREKWDVDGNRYLDFFGGHGALMLGHSHPKVVAAVRQAFQNGIQFAANHPGELLWAEAIQRCFPSGERVRFTGSGSEATLLAIRMARAYSGRAKLVRIMSHYHGWHDLAVSGYSGQFDGSAAPGVLPEIAANTLLVRPDDIAGLKACLAQHAGQIAAIIVEPLGAHFGHTPTSDEFLLEAAAEARRRGVLLIFDEVISAFRVGLGGMQGYLGLRPDLTCLAKIAAGGMPGGVVIGSAEVMSVLDSKDALGHPNPRKVLHQGTFTGNPVTAAAAVVTIAEIADGDLCARASQLAAGAREALNALFERRAAGWLAYGRFSSLNVLPIDPVRRDPRLLSQADYMARDLTRLGALRMALNLEGVDIGARGAAFLSGVHTQDDVDRLVEAFDRALARLEAR
ncbi:aspartate aminotransferase family protein [Caulobacter soli]|uniref:aspartate aminotransferase family protein n=1 Tax=Caulobacter soli TaxID=2708539 RepID=UPI0013E9BE32|nr:aminotransferase class III-fold pyridoxal phosphate-dependent enzyme [Caulobacter soli]